ncbi:MAG: tetratricopeptide repeat protein [Treponema sp.]|jgi:tetratricopeptide (TPR) repeat protein|nr:tetratricopeptide repeat protein [Treponema sp.]
MKIRKENILGLLVVLILGGGIMGVYFYEKRNTNAALAARMAELSPKGGPPETIEGLRAAIAAYGEAVEAHVRDAAQTGTYWKILATRLADKGMHQDALEALEMALRYNAEDPTIFYLTGVSAGIAAKSSLDFPQPGEQVSRREGYLGLSERAYLRAIELDKAYAKPRYALGVLYSFELERPGEAIPHLSRYLELMPRDVDGMFVLARAYYMTGQYAEAIDLYDRILVTTRDTKKQEEARNNRDYIRGQVYG